MYHPTHRDVAGIDVIRPRLIVDEGELDSRVIVGKNVGVPVLCSVVSHERSFFGMI